MLFTLTLVRGATIVGLTCNVPATGGEAALFAALRAVVVCGLALVPALAGAVVLRRPPPTLFVPVRLAPWCWRGCFTCVFWNTVPLGSTGLASMLLSISRLDSASVTPEGRSTLPSAACMSALELPVTGSKSLWRLRMM
jgi:hypothetical protein